MRRHEFHNNGLKLSYLDNRGSGRPLVALHAHWMEGVTYLPLAQALAPEWRVISLDQRGHGHSDHADTYSRDDYLSDLSALFAELGISAAVLLGNSLGGVNAYQFAALHPACATALIIEDTGAVIDDDVSFSLAWGGWFSTEEDLARHIGPKMAPYLKSSFRVTSRGWTLAFDPKETFASQKALNGDHWKDWLATDCPAMLIRGRQSPITKENQVAVMAALRPNTRLEIIDAGHLVHVDNPDGFTNAVRRFLQSL